MLSESTLVSLPTAGQLSELGRLDQLVTLALQQEHEEPSNSFTTFDNTDKDSTTSSARHVKNFFISFLSQSTTLKLCQSIESK